MDESFGMRAPAPARPAGFGLPTANSFSSAANGFGLSGVGSTTAASSSLGGFGL